MASAFMHAFGAVNFICTCIIDDPLLLGCIQDQRKCGSSNSVVCIGHMSELSFLSFMFTLLENFELTETAFRFHFHVNKPGTTINKTKNLCKKIPLRRKQS